MTQRDSAMSILTLDEVQDNSPNVTIKANSDDFGHLIQDTLDIADSKAGIDMWPLETVSKSSCLLVS